MSPRPRLIDPHREPLIQFVLFALLVVATPFVVVTKYLQNTVHLLSHLNFSFFGEEVPFIVSLAILLFLSLLIRYFRQITLKRLAALLLIGAMWGYSYWSMDLYSGVAFFDLQANWHYLAYGVYVFFFFRAFQVQRLPLQKMILYAFLSAVCMSTFDETFQLFLSQRVFDLSDITKDAWGAMMSLILVLFVTKTYGTIDFKKAALRKKHWREYLQDPATVLLAVFTLTLIFVTLSPRLTEHAEAGNLLIIALALFALIAITIHLTRQRVFRRLVQLTIALVVSSLIASFLLHRQENITYSRFGLCFYKGLPLPFFDVLIYPDGAFRFVDKKHHFRSQDKEYFLKQKPAILLIGSGWQGNGGKGFDQGEGVHFIYNEFAGRGTQVIILPTPTACQKFNELKAAGKNVLLVLHSTC